MKKVVNAITNICNIAGFICVGEGDQRVWERLHP